MPEHDQNQLFQHVIFNGRTGCTEAIPGATYTPQDFKAHGEKLATLPEVKAHEESVTRFHEMVSQGSPPDSPELQKVKDEVDRLGKARDEAIRLAMMNDTYCQALGAANRAMMAMSAEEWVRTNKRELLERLSDYENQLANVDPIAIREEVNRAEWLERTGPAQLTSLEKSNAREYADRVSEIKQTVNTLKLWIKSESLPHLAKVEETMRMLEMKIELFNTWSKRAVSLNKASRTKADSTADTKSIIIRLARQYVADTNPKPARKTRGLAGQIKSSGIRLSEQQINAVLRKHWTEIITE